MLRILIKILNFKFLRFIGVGGVNTLVSYSIYVYLIFMVDYQVAYAVAFVIGILLSYWLNTRFVFNTGYSKKKFILFPIVYVIQYIFGALLLNIIVEHLSFNKIFAPILVVIFLLPLTYVLSKKILKGS